MISSIVTAALFMVALGVTLAVILAIANKKLFVYEDPRIEEVDEMLPQAQCGACGVPGCRPFAEAVVSGQKTPRTAR
nr:(Fe-S)-binding protein [Methylomarinum sp. Ch1-1]MDP4519131.1 (Fe-S)-binding protein [Methylomarinum sp. Ch1-1]